MKNKLYIHIGLHKTATTSLQKFVFPRLPSFKFIGRNDLPLNNQNELYLELVKYCFSKKQDKPKEVELRSALITELKANKVILSDEWFSADFDGFYKFEGASWQMKLDKLSRIINGLDYKLVVTLRDPFDGVFSQYSEFNQVGIESKYSTFKEYFYNSNDSNVYK
ncbi:hypothetical protein L1D46_20865, partial [Pseudoalteromonas sp. Isolate3]|uniref:hypothetical protein n=1 Tax=Pseudoalteromonas sp. Isolate3 TaxID=2908526 RepID=UPI001EFC8C24